MAIPRMINWSSTPGITPMTNGDGTDVPVSGNTTVRPDPSRSKGYAEEPQRDALRTTAVLRCPCIVNGQPLWGYVYRSFFNALETPNSLSCPTQTTICDPLSPPGRAPCTTTNHTAKGSDYDRFSTK